MVEAGDLLFRIEREPYQANVAARRADVDRTNAALTNARLQRERLEPLVPRGGATQAQLDAAIAAQQEAGAAVDAIGGAFDTQLLGGRISASWGGAVFIVAGSSTADDTAIRNPYGGYPGYFAPIAERLQPCRRRRLTGGCVL